MRSFCQNAIVAVLGCLLSGSAIACSDCGKKLMSEEEFDRRGWDYAEHVFVGLVTRSELVPKTSEIRYAVEPDEILKGNPDTVERIYSHRLISEWNGLEMWACGDLIVSVGDRIIVFANSDGQASLGLCSSSRVIEGVAAPVAAEVERTLQRLRQWSEEVR